MNCKQMNPEFFSAFYLNIQYFFTLDLVFLSDSEAVDLYCMGGEL